MTGTTIPRDVWGAVGRYDRPMTLPALDVWVHHSVTQATDHDAVYELTDRPELDARTIERIGIERFGRGSYSYLFHPSGVELVLAGTTVGAHTAGRNSRSFGLCLIGNYSTYRPTDPQLAAVARRIRRLRAAGALVDGHGIGPHRAVKATECPGRHMMDRWTDLLHMIDNPETPMAPYEYIALVTITEDAPPIQAGRHYFHVAGTTAVHVGAAGLGWLRDERKLPEVEVVDGPSFLDAHDITFGNL